MWLLLDLAVYAGAALAFLLVAGLAGLLYITFYPKRIHELQGLCCVVTGASQGLGVYIAHALAAEKVSKLVLGARSTEKLDGLKSDLAKRYPDVEVLTLKLDVSDTESRKEFFRRAVAFGRCQVLINNAGIIKNRFFQSMTDEDLDAVLHTNLVGTLHLTKLFLPEMLKHDRGHVVNISSISGFTAAPYGSVYAATKAALSSFSASLRLEMQIEKQPVTFHCVSPGLISDVGIAVSMAGNAGMTVKEAGKLLGWSTPAKVAETVIRVIQYDEPEVIVNPMKAQPIFALTTLFPRLWEIMFPILKALGLDGLHLLRNEAVQFEAEQSKG